MYISGVNPVDNREKINAVIHAYGFATMITDPEGKPWASHLPAFLDETSGQLRSNMARANEQLQGHRVPEQIEPAGSGAT